MTRMKKCVLCVLIIKDLPSFLQDEASPCYCPSSSILCWIRFGPCTGGAEHSEIFFIFVSLLQPSLLENASIAMNRIWFDRTFRFLKEPMFLGPWHMELARLLK